MAMNSPAQPLEEVYDALEGALEALDCHGEAIAALHLAMAVDCLKATLAGDMPVPFPSGPSRGYLRLVRS